MFKHCVNVRTYVQLEAVMFILNNTEGEKSERNSISEAEMECDEHRQRREEGWKEESKAVLGSSICRGFAGAVFTHLVSSSLTCSHTHTHT